MTRILCLCLLAAALLVRLPGPSTAATTHAIYLPLAGTTPHSGNYIHISNRGIFLGNVARTTRTPLLPNTAVGSYRSPAWSPDGRRVSAVYRQGAATALVTVDIRSSAVVTLTDSRLPNHPSIDLTLASPAWSADGRWIAVPATDGVYRVSPGGGAPLRLTDQRGALSWSPAGAALVVSNASGHYLINPDAATTVRILTQRGMLHWAPRGTQLAISSAGGTYLVTPATGAVRQLIAAEGTPTWSPDSAALAISSAGGTYLATPATGAVRRLIAAKGTPTWSPDSTALAISSDNGTYLAKVATGAVTQIERGSSTVIWSPDSQYVVYTWDGLVRRRADGSGRTQLTSFGHKPAWSPNGAVIAFIESSGPDTLPPFERMHLLNLRTLQTEQVDETSDLLLYPRWSPSSRWLVYGWYRDSIKGGVAMRALDLEQRERVGGCGAPGRWDLSVPVLSESCSELTSSGAIATRDNYYNGDMERILSVYNDGISETMWIQWSPA